MTHRRSSQSPNDYGSPRQDKAQSSKHQTILSRLAAAEAHAKDLHSKLKASKMEFNQEITQVSNQALTFKTMYEDAVLAVQERDVEIKDMKKKIKKQTEQIDDDQRKINQCKQLVAEQQIRYQILQEQNLILKRQIQVVKPRFDRRSALKQSKVIRDLQLKLKLLQDGGNSISPDFNQLRQLHITRTAAAQLQGQLEHVQQRVLSLEDTLRETSRGYQQLKESHRVKCTQFDELTNKYNETLKFHYEVQRDIEKQLHSVAKELTRRQLNRGKMQVA